MQNAHTDSGALPTVVASDSAPRGRKGHLKISGFSKRYGSLLAARDVSIEIEAGEFFSLLGPSGSGKTTTMMAIAGFVTPDEGTIELDGVRLDRVPVERRGVGVVFQNYALFPHLTVWENLAFPLETRRVPNAQIRDEVEQMLGVVQLEGRENHYPTQLSGGQQQRVALARALISRPSVLLMDEPLGALDRNLRGHLQHEIRRVQREFGITTIYVTHDQDEAFTMSDRIAVMNNGGIEQLGTPADIYRNPKTLFAANFVGDNNVLQGTVTGVDRDAVEVLCAGSVVRCRAAELKVGDDVNITVRPEAIRLGTDGTSGGNRLKAVVEDHVFTGPTMRYHVRLADGTPMILVESGFDHSFHEIGAQVELAFPAHSASVFLNEDAERP
ncbi:ABC transporter ATP-binding protein [Microbacterium soli]|uniref:Spermidine/putrescine import ATP-binding protein PotA n=1 Tax=Microbacterium soli TaxID=446075 RepID=A0ABP7MZB6_9MICO